MRTLRVLKFLILFTFFGIASLHAAKRYWIKGTAGYWNNTANWSTTSGGAGGASVPGSSDTAYFNGGGVGNDSLDMNITVTRIEIASGYTGRFVQKTYTITTTTFSIAAGTFQGGSASMTCNGAFSVSGGTFTSTSGTLTAASNFSITGGTFNHNNGTVSLTATSTLTVSNTGGSTFYKLAFAPVNNSTYTITSTTTITVSNDLIYGGTAARSITVNTGTINVTGNLTITNTSNAGGGSANIILNGSGSQTLTGSGTGNGGRLSNVQINKSGGTLSLVSTISVLGNWTYTAGTISAGTSVLYFIGSKTIAGNHTLCSAAFVGGYTYTITSTDTLTLEGYMSTGGSSAMTLNSGTLVVKGNITIYNTATGTNGSATIRIRGNRNHSLAGMSIAAGQGALPHVIIEKGDSTLTLSGVVTINGNLTYVKGTVDPGTNTMVLTGNYNLDGQGTSSTMSFYNITIYGNTRTLTGNLDVNNNLTINSTCTLSGGSYTMNVGGNWSNSGTWTYSTSTVIIDGSGYKSIAKSSGTETFYNLTLNRSTAAGSLTLSCPVTVNNAFTLTKCRLKTTTTNYLTLIDNATLSGGGIGAYVHGPVRKTGNDAFTFPLGDTTLTDSTAYHPLTITAPSSTSDQYEAIYRATGQTYGSGLGSGLASLSTCEYWTLDRKAGTSNVTPKLGWNSNCDNGSFSEMHVASWNGSQWADFGQASYTMTWPNGTVTASTALTFSTNPAPLTIGYASTSKSFATLSKTMDGGYYLTDGYVLYFGFDEEYKDADAKLSFKVYKVSTDRQVTLVSNPANNPSDYYGNNRYKMDLFDNSNAALASGYYVLEVTNDRNEKWYLRFKI